MITIYQIKQYAIDKLWNYPTFIIFNHGIQNGYFRIPLKDKNFTSLSSYFSTKLNGTVKNILFWNVSLEKEKAVWHFCN